MKGRRPLATLVAVAMLFSSAVAMTGCATKRQLADLETKVDQALSQAQAADATAQAKQAEAAAEIAPAESAAHAREDDEDRSEEHLGDRPGGGGEVGGEAQEPLDAPELAEVEKEVVADHEDDGQPSQEIDLPDALTVL